MKLADLKAGHCVFADTGFTCMAAGLHIVEADEHGLYVQCSEGHHYLDGQEDDDGELVGLSPGLDNRTTQEVLFDEKAAAAERS